MSYKEHEAYLDRVSGKHLLEKPQTVKEFDAVNSLERLKKELRQVIIKVNYHFHSGYERHVQMQTPESIFLNFLKKEVKEIPSGYLFRICKKDFNLEMKDGFVFSLTFFSESTKHDWRTLDDKLKLLKEAASTLDFPGLAAQSHTLDKFYQQSYKALEDIKNFKFK